MFALLYWMDKKFKSIFFFLYFYYIFYINYNNSFNQFIYKSSIFVNFQNKINETYENNKVNFCWEIMIIIYMTILIILPPIIIIFYECHWKLFFEEIFICNLCEREKCKIFKCKCDLGYCECLKCLKSCGCDCN